LIYSLAVDSTPQYDEGINTTSSSPYFTNNIEISSNRKVLEYSFTGAGNVAFTRALAITIFMAGRRNKTCMITHNAVNAAEKSAMYSDY
jgi:hypothetical protein